MGTASTITIKEIILHRLSADETGKAPQCSQRRLPANTDPDVFAYFQTHIGNSLAHPQARAARFKDLGQPVAGACQDLLAGGDLVAASQLLAEALYGVVKEDRRIAQGDLIVCLYDRGNKKTSNRGLALLKIDPVQVFEHQALTDQEGRKYITLVKKGAMPTTREELQKCAFIRPLKARLTEPADLEMTLLDRQRTGDKEVADFFSRGFLGATLVVDDRQATLRAIDAFAELENELRPLDLWQPVEPEVRKVLSAPRAHLSKRLVGRLGLPPQVRERFEESLRKKEILDLRFTVEGTALAKATQKTVYEGDYELEVKVLASQFETVVRSVKRLVPEVGLPYFEITLHTKQWRRKA